ncbi:hypothetical protein EPJ64_08910 [Brachyspira aalborgi]|jgi:inositol transport system substrate-binding protein|uniref:Periplasmic binding protein domain-containing protein n=1 Tax=Brachyspira aalborgi TaxID=29522 RepID=A0A5C8FZL3_9SPIR|nr:sugar ABC transporter substrate-binding protein [Brachyspira aalborgi]CCY76528.1 putative sugar ABC transporter periplasmic sugar-binding [Brachyspira sp. CAG:700]TXJ15323.1 hypothetical protein EPJ77_09305 [Brachyspira aalborgi]TXJ18039.1 hypothetical protein EPJ64_08910 [Brachyspira aalborgi]TXJ32085.1 hypothetical protein EPJ71_08285 [Brachyspira aalborgi]TXJ42441.1 hypothetical protein EPJ65_06685 [Brachyspira aalborgi]
MRNLLLILLFLGTINCSNKQESINENKIKIALIYGINTTFIETLINDINDYKESNYPNITFIELNASEDTVKQQSQIETLITQGIDGIMLQIANTGIASSIDAYVKANNIPTLYYNIRPTTLQEGTYSYVGMNEKSVGYIQAQEVLKVRSNGNAVILLGDQNNESTLLRTSSVMESISNTQIKILATAYGNWYDNIAESIMEKWINLNNNIDIVFSNNDDMAVGSIRAIERAGKKLGTNNGEIMVLGVDATPNGIQSIKDGKMYATVKQDGKLEAKIIVDSIVDMINNNKNRTVLIEPEVITIENINEIEK